MTKEKVLEAMKEAEQMANASEWAVCIPSYTRPNFRLGKLLRKCTPEFLATHVFIFVHADELEAYKKFNPNLNYVIVPPEYYGVGYTRDYVYTWGKGNLKRITFCWDDDIKNLTFMYASTDCYGYHSTKHSSKTDEQADPLFTQHILCYTAYIAQFLFTAYPNLMLGNIRRQRFCGDVTVHQTLANINKGATPRQTNIMNTAVYQEGYFPESSRWHGDDIIIAAKILQDGKDLFSIQQVGYDFVSEQEDTTLRDTDENTERNKQIHAKEYQDLMQFEIRKYLKTAKAYPNGDYMYGDVDWRRFYALHPERKGFSLKVGE